MGLASGYAQPSGGDTYVFGRGYGQDTIYDYDTAAGNVDTIRLAPGVSPSDVTLWRDNTHWYLKVNDTGDQLQVQSWKVNSSCRIEQVVFADGTVWDSAMLTTAPMLGTEAADAWAGTAENDVMGGFACNDSLTGNDGADVLEGGDDADVLTGGAGVDVLDGGSGNDLLYRGFPSGYASSASGDIYVFGHGYGRDTIFDLDSTAGNVDTIRLLPGVTPNDVTSWRSNQDWYLKINGTDDQLKVQSWKSRSNFRIEQVVFAGGVVWNSTILASAPILSSIANDSITAGAENDLISGFDGDDAITGNGGNDLLQGNAGNDTLNDVYGSYLFTERCIEN